MANIGLNGRIRNNENDHDLPLRTKQMSSNEGRSIKKQIFGELKNVMHGQQIGLTPVKANAAKLDGLPGKLGASSSLCNDLLRKQHLKQNFLDVLKFEQKLKLNTAAESYREPVFDEEIFDSWDYDRKCCQNPKREEEIWAEMDLARLNFDNNICIEDEDDVNARSKDPILFEDFDDDLLTVTTFNSMIEIEPPTMNEMPEILDYFEDLVF